MKLCYQLPLVYFLALSFSNQHYCNAQEYADETASTKTIRGTNNRKAEKKQDLLHDSPPAALPHDHSSAGTMKKPRPPLTGAIDDDGDHERRYIVKFKSASQFASADYKLQNDDDKTNSIRIMALPKESAEVMTLQSDDEVEYWNNRDDVEYVEPDSKVYLHQSSEHIPWGIKYVKALSVSDGPVSNQKVCIIDSGYDRAHPDLPSSSSIVTGESDSWWTDQSGHGTHVAGTIAATGDNGRGVVGVIRNGQVKLHIVKVFGAEGKWIWSSNLINAAEKCVEAGSTVINMSLGGGGFSRTENDTFDRIFNQDGIIVVASAGNDGNSSYNYPASYPSVISVASITSSKERSHFSQFNNQVDLAAPGSKVLSTVPGGGYRYFDGTSMAAPHVSGVAALIWSHFPTKTAKEIRQALEASAEDLGPTGRDDEYGHGLVRADLAYNMLSGGNNGNGRSFVKWQPNTALYSENRKHMLWYTADGRLVVYSFGRGIVWSSNTPVSNPGIATFQRDGNLVLYRSNNAGPYWASNTCCSANNKIYMQNDGNVVIRDANGGILWATNTSSCADSPSNWYDSDGSQYNCEWYASGSRCAQHGHKYRNFGKTANEACCACGGGSRNEATGILFEKKSLGTSNESRNNEPLLKID